MTHILQVKPSELIVQAAEQLKQQKMVQPLEWSVFVKTGHFKERQPENPDWWYHRAASVLRTIAKLGPVGTEKLRTKYGGRKNRGYQPGRFFKASGSIIRKILQQLEKSGLIEQTKSEKHKGRILSAKGTSLLDKIAVQIAKKEHKEMQQ